MSAARKKKSRLGVLALLFLALKGINRLKKPAVAAAPPPPPPRQEVLLEEIRDLLRKG